MLVQTMDNMSAREAAWAGNRPFGSSSYKVTQMLYLTTDTIGLGARRWAGCKVRSMDEKLYNNATADRR